MLNVRGPVIGGVLAGVVVLAGACSGSAASEAPSPPAGTVPVTPSVSSASPSSTPDPGSTTPDEGSPSPSGPSSGEPSPGGEPDVEPRRPVETAPPTKLDGSARTAGAVVSLESVRATTITATTPGDRSGPGVLVRLKLVNATGRALDTRFLQVGVTDRTETPGTLVDGPPTDAPAASVRPGRSVRGTYAFLLDDASAGPVTVSVYVTSGQPVVTFRGRPS